jgi:hypothetical protein
MIVFDLFSGTGSSTQAFQDAGHTVISFEIDKQFECTHTIDVMKLNAEALLIMYGKPDFVWASPPCTSFSVASIGHHWIKGGANPLPRTPEAAASQELVRHTIALIKDLNPKFGWLIENPRGMLRKLPVVAGLPHRTITYCQYGDTRMKPTDLWGEVTNWIPRTPCKNGMTCHVAAPRGSLTGTQGIKGAKDRSRVPLDLSIELLAAMDSSTENKSE